jgi:hypothetical protein
MTFANRLKVAENLPISSREGFQRNSRPTFWLKSIFVGPNGLRAWLAGAHVHRFVRRSLEVSFSSEPAGFKAFGSSTGTKVTLRSRRL